MKFKENQVRLGVIISLVIIIILLLVLIFTHKVTLPFVTTPHAFPTLMPRSQWTKEYIDKQMPKLEDLKKCGQYSVAPYSDKENWGEITQVDKAKKTITVKGNKYSQNSLEGIQIFLADNDKALPKDTEPSGMLLATAYSFNEALPYLQAGATVKIIKGPFAYVLRVYCY